MALTLTEKRLGKVITGINKLIKIQQKSTTEFNKQTTAVKRQAKVVEVATKEMYSLADAQDTASKTNNSLFRSFAKAADGAGKYGKRWTMVSRILSGSPIWKLQNYFRAAGQAMHGFYTRQEEAAKVTNDQAKAFSELHNQLGSVKGQIKSLRKGLKGNHSNLLETNQEYANMFNALTAGLDKEKDLLKIEEAKRDARARTLSMYEKTHKTLLKNQVSEGESLKKAMVVEEKLRKEADLKKYASLAKEQKKAQKLVEKLRKKGGSEKEIMAAQKVQRSAKGKMGHFSASVGGGMAQELKESQKIMVRFEKTVVGKMAKQAANFMTLGILPIYRSMKKLNKKVNETGGYGKYIKKAMGSVWKVTKMAGMYMMYFVLFLLGAFLIFSVIREIFKKTDALNIIMETLSGVFDGIKTVLDGVFDIFGAFFGEGTFGERLQLLVEGVGKIFGGLGKILWSVLKGVVMFAWDIVLAYVTFVMNMWVGIISGIATTIGKFFSNIWEGITGLWDGAMEWLFDEIVDPIVNFFDMVGDFVDDILDALDMDLFHTGGTSSGRMAIVGERGPELVNLPAGSKVHSHDTTKSKVGGSTVNNISVNVNGRLGASDTELRDIAKKIGRMVSTEINRTTSSSTNVRF